MRPQAALYSGRRIALAAMLWVGLLLAAAAPAVAQTPQIHATWNSGVLNVSVSDLPPNGEVEVSVHDESSNSNEQANGHPSGTADGAGNWPGGAGGGETGYPGTANDSGGTRYTICVRVNGQTGPCKGTVKPRGLLPSIGHAIITIGGLFGMRNDVPVALRVA